MTRMIVQEVVQDVYMVITLKSKRGGIMNLIEAIDELTKSVDVFEVNTGAIARGYRKTPYPQDFILKELKKRGCGIIITSDCHDNRFLDYKFDEALHLVKACGFKEVLKMTDKGFEASGI